MGCWAKFVGLLDSFMVYDTVSIVRIKDKRLALLYYAFMVLIFFYVVVYTIIWEKGYNQREMPIGTVRINPMAPPEWKNASDLPYCRVPGHTEYQNYSTYPCLYYDEYYSIFPQALDNTITISTRISRYNETPSNPYFNDSSSTWNDSPEEIFYMADIERFTFQLEHAFFATELNIQGNARDLSGMLTDIKGKNLTYLANYSKFEKIGLVGTKDIIAVGTLLRLANIDLDTLVVEAGNNSRYTGITVFVIIDYSNSRSWNPFNTESTYTIRAQLLENTKYKSEQAVYTGNLSEVRTILDRHGIHFVFLQSGLLSKFSFKELLLSFVSGMALISVATVVVDVLSTKILGSRNVITNMKYQETTDLVNLTDDQMDVLAEKFMRRNHREYSLGVGEDEGYLSIPSKAEDEPLLSPSEPHGNPSGNPSDDSVLASVNGDDAAQAV